MAAFYSAKRVENRMGPLFSAFALKRAVHCTAFSHKNVSFLWENSMKAHFMENSKKSLAH